MTAHQVFWAAQHDWFFSNKKLDFNNYVVIARDDETVGEFLEFSDFQELRIWAGY